MASTEYIDPIQDILAHLATITSELDTVHGFINRQEIDSVRNSIGSIQGRIDTIAGLVVELELDLSESINDDQSEETDVDRPGTDNGDSNGDTQERQAV